MKKLIAIYDTGMKTFCTLSIKYLNCYKVNAKKSDKYGKIMIISKDGKIIRNELGGEDYAN